MANRSALEHKMSDDQKNRLLVNGEVVLTNAVTLDELIVALGYGGRKVATAVNGDFVAEKVRGTTPLKAGDAVEIVAPRQGG